jgi:16S rRNA processing protein RimM
VCIGVIVGAHGIKGGVRVKCFIDQPQDFGAYGPVQDESGQKRFKAKVQGVSKGLALISLDGVADRTQAEAMKGIRLYVDRNRLPKVDEDEYLVGDLIGCQAFDPNGQALGVVTNVFDFGAGEVLEVKGKAGELLVPFTKAAVPEVDIGAKRVVIEPPVYAPDDKDEEKGFEPDDSEVEGIEVEEAP